MVDFVPSWTHILCYLIDVCMKVKVTVIFSNVQKVDYNHNDSVDYNNKEPKNTYQRDEKKP